MKSENIGLRASVELHMPSSKTNRGAGGLLPLISGSRNESGEAVNTQDMHTFVSRQSQSCLASVSVILTKHRY